jgi:hypothetical protein
MSVMPQNIIEIQSALQDPVRVSMNDLIKYVNGSNPEVPSFLALIEMNRRKNIKDTTPDEEVSSGTVKDQTISSLMGRQGVDPTVRAAGVNPAMAQQMVDPTMRAKQVMPQQAPQPMNPAATVQAAKGGLMSIPVNMFKAKNYAAGGIVAFDKGGTAEDKYVEVSPGNFVLKSELDAAKKASQPVRGDSYVRESPGGKYVMRSEMPRQQAQAKPTPAAPVAEPATSGNDQWMETSPGSFALSSEVGPKFQPRQQYKVGNQTILGPQSMEEIMAGLPGLTPLQGTRPADMTIEQAAQRRKAIMKEAGVSEDPYAESRKFQEGIEARQAKEREGDPLDRLLAMGRAFAKADPTKGFGFQAATASEASSALEASQRAIRDKQDAVSRDFRQAAAKEEDARRRGDADGIAAALARQKQDQAEYDRLQIEYDKAQQGRYKTAAEIRQGQAAEAKLPLDVFDAETRRKQAEAQERHQGFLRSEAERTRPSADDILYTKIVDKVNKDPQIKQRVDLQKNEPAGSAEYIRLQKEINALIRSHFSKAPHLMPEIPEILPPPVVKKPEGVSSLKESFKNTFSLIPGMERFHPGYSAPGKLPPGWSVQVTP